MAEKVNIASLSIDFDDVIKQSAKYKAEIEKTKKAQKELDQTTEAGRLAFVKYDAQLKNLKKSYRDNQTFASALDSVNKDLEKTMSTQNKSTQELRDSRRELNQISKQIVGNTEEEIQLRTELNEAIDEQTEALRNQSSEFNSSKDQIGEYENGFKSAFAQIDITNGGISGFVQRSQEAGGTGKLLTSSLGGMIKGFVGVTKASIGFIATPVGVFLGVVAGAFLLVQNAMNRSETATNKIKKALSAFSGIINGVLKVLEPLGEFLIDGLVAGFELVEKGVFSAMEGIQTALNFLGFDETAESMKGFVEGVRETTQASKELVVAEVELQKAQRLSQKIQLDFQKEAEKLRQIRDDVSKTDAERQKANEDLGVVLKQQLESELQIANQALEVSRLRIEAEGATKEALDQQAEALTTISDIQERITGQESEQLTNRVALQKEASDKAKKIQEENLKRAQKVVDNAIKRQNEELTLYIEGQGIKKKTLQEQLDFEKTVSDKKKEILKAELEANKITQIQFDTELLRIKNDLLQKQAEIAVENAQKELEDYVRGNQSKVDSEKFLSEQIFEEERSRLERLAEQRRGFEAKRLEEGVISETEYNSAINEVNKANSIAKTQLQAERDEAQKEKEIIDFENKLALDAERSELDLEQALLYLERGKQDELKAAEATGANKTLIEEKYANAEVEIKRKVSENKLSLASDTLGNLITLMGKESAAGKAVAVAQATIDTYSSAVSAFNSLSGIPIVGPVLGGIAAAAAVASGIATVRQIVSTPKPSIPSATFAKGGILNGASHANGGIQTRFGELEGGEAVINRRSTSMFAPLLSSINQAGGGKAFANGGILGQAGQPSSMFDYDLFAEKTSQAVASLPNPVVGVDEITRVSGRVAEIEEVSTF